MRRGVSQGRTTLLSISHASPIFPVHTHIRACLKHLQLLFSMSHAHKCSIKQGSHQKNWCSRMRKFTTWLGA